MCLIVARWFLVLVPFIGLESRISAHVGPSAVALCHGMGELGGTSVCKVIVFLIGSNTLDAFLIMLARFRKGQALPTQTVSSSLRA